MGEGWGRVFRGLSIAGVLALSAVGLAELPAGCGSGHPANLTSGNSNGTGATPSCSPGKQGCACTDPGQKVDCGEVVTNAGNYVTCQMGTSTCTNGTWTACQGSTLIKKSLGAVQLGPEHILSVSAPCGGANLCDPNPNCTQVTGAPTSDVDAAFVYETDAGVTLVPPDAGPLATCTPGSLQCDVVTCAEAGTTTTITGVVTDPAGNNPLYGVTVYVPLFPTAALPTFTEGVSCDTCGGAASLQAVSVTTTGTDGSFTLTNVPSGTGLPAGSGIPLVVQSGKWRREIMLDSVTPCASNNMSAMGCTATDQSLCALRLPQSATDGYNVSDGLYDHADLPQIAMVTGSADPLECILVKAGISLTEFSSYDQDVSPKTGHHHVHFFQSPSSPGTSLDPKYGTEQGGDVLWLDSVDPKSQTAPYVAPHYNYYDVVLDACEGSAIDKQPLYTKKGGSAGKPYQNLIDYTDIGGRAFLTHFSYVWIEYPSKSGTYASASDNWSGVANWTSVTGTTSTQDPLTASINTTFPKGIAFSSWLQNVGASTTANKLTLHEARQDLTTVSANAEYWMTAKNTSPPAGKTGTYDPHFTFNTQYGVDAGAQCGRVVFSDFHVTADALVGNGNPTCYDTASCGYGQSCTGSVGASGTCAEPCATKSDCADSTYTCVGATAGTCQPESCTPGATAYSCTTGTCASDHSTCLCTANSQCTSGFCVNTAGQCSASCTGTGNAFNPSCCSGSGTTDPNGCQADTVTTCTLTTHYSCATTLTPAPVLNGTLPTPTACLCVKDSDCASNHCSNVGSQCTVANNATGPSACTGTTTAGTYDSADCQELTASLSSPATCASGLTPAAVISGSACICVKDSDCSSGHCSNVGSQCTVANNGTGASVCTGTTTSGTYDAADCQIQGTVGSPVEGCAKGGCDFLGGGCLLSGATCYCTADSQCPSGASGASSGHCVPVTGQNDLSCSGCTGPAASAHDAFNCELVANGIPPTATGATFACPAGHTGGAGTCDTATGAGQSCGTGGTPCWCAANSQCPSGECLTWSGCGGGVGTGTSQCVNAATQGTNALDDYHCVLVSPGIPTTPAPVYTCPMGETGATGACESGGTAATCSTTTHCWCTSNAQCQSGSCLTWSACSGGSGSSGSQCVSSASGNSVDDYNCVLVSPGIGTSPTSNYTCPMGETGATGACESGGSPTACSTSTPCWCTSNGQCPSGSCLHWTGCSGTGATSGLCVSSASGSSVDDYNCLLVAPGIPSAPSATYACSAAEAGNGAGKCANTWPNPASVPGTCSGSTPCLCTANDQCVSGQCVTWAGCSGGTGAGTTQCVTSAGTNNIDSYNCVLVANGIPSSPAATSSTFNYTPSNFTPTSYTANVPASATTVNCNLTYTSPGTAGASTWCGGTGPYVIPDVAQSSGPNVDVLVFNSLTINAGSTLTLLGENPVVLAVYGNAAINGAIQASAPASGTTVNVGTVSVIGGSTTINFTNAQTLPAGTQLTFASQGATTYTLSAAMNGTSTGTLTAAYNGTSTVSTTVANGSSAVTFGAAQSLPAGTTVVFPSSSTTYTLGSAVNASTSGTLGSNFNGVLSGTAGVVGTAVTFSTAQTLPSGGVVQFSSQAGTNYTLAAAVNGSTSATLTSSYTGSSTLTVVLEPTASNNIIFASPVTLPSGQAIVIGGTTYHLSAAMTNATVGTVTVTPAVATTSDTTAYTTSGSTTVTLSGALTTTIPSGSAIKVNGVWVGTLASTCSAGATSCTLASGASASEGNSFLCGILFNPPCDYAINFVAASTTTLANIAAGATTTLKSGTMNATVSGAITTAAWSGTLPGPGGNNTSYCSAPQNSQDNSFGFLCSGDALGGGGGGGRAIAGGKGGDVTSSNNPASGGGQNGSSAATPLLGGCPGGTGGVAGGAGGGGVQISVAGTLTGSGSISTNGGAGTSGSTNAGGGGGSAGDILLEGASIAAPTLSAGGGNGGAGGTGTGGDTGGAGGTGGTNNGTTQSSVGITGGNPSNPNTFLVCTPAAGGGGGGAYGYVVQNHHSCATSLAHAPIANGTATACLCTNNADCSSGSCAYVNGGTNDNHTACGSTTNCSGSASATLDTANCVVIAPTASALSCPNGEVASGGASPTCLCVKDSQCASGKCGNVTSGNNANSTACGGNCSGGTSNLDGANCAILEPSTPTTYTCSPGMVNTTHTACLCTNNTQCASGLCGLVAAGANANTSGCGGSTTNCSGGASGLDAADCAILEPQTPTYSCSTGTPNSNHTACLCTNNSQCASGLCGLVTSGTNANATGCSNSSTNCSGGTTGLDAADCAPLPSSTSASAFCNTTLTPTPAAVGGACLCTADTDCGSGHCSNAGSQCPLGNTCSGTLTAGSYDSADCQNGPISGATGVTTYSCSTGACESGGSATSCTAATPCWCTKNSQCNSGACEQWNGCALGQCTTSTAATDGFHCILEAPGIPAAPTPAVYSCPSVGSNGAGACESSGSAITCASGSQCWCSSNAQCPESGECLTWNGCTGGTGTGSTQCIASAGSNTTDDYHCVLASPGIPAPTATPISSCTSGFCSVTGSGDVCWCTADSQCGTSGLCIPWSGCATGACNGSVAGTPNDFHCQEPSSVPPAACTATTAYSCSAGQCNLLTTTCQCTADSQCPSGQCVDSGQCASGACSGSGLTDASSCVPSNVTTCSANADCGGNASVEGCSGALGTCQCSGSTSCGAGLTCQAGTANGISGNYCTGCTKASQCKDLSHPPTCSGGSGAVAGKCCNEADPAVGDAAVTSSCGLNAKLFPEACLQSPMSAQEQALEFMFFDLTSCVTPDSPPVTSLNLVPETFDLDFTASCPSGTAAKWRQLDFSVTLPNPVNGSGISIAAQTGAEATDGGAMEAGTLLPATPLALVTNEQTTGAYTVLLDTTGGLFTTASPALVSQGWLRLSVTLTPTADGNYSPTLNSWNVLYDCPAAE